MEGLGSTAIGQFSLAVDCGIDKYCFSVNLINQYLVRVTKMSVPKSQLTPDLLITRISELFPSVKIVSFQPIVDRLSLKENYPIPPYDDPLY